MLSPHDVAASLEQSPVIIPTETVFGVTALATQVGVSSLYTLKKRSQNKPLAVLASSLDHAASFITIPSAARKALAKLWPGPLTFIGEALDKDLARILNTPTIGVRVSSHPIIKQIFQHITQPLVLTSANISGDLSITALPQLPETLKALPHIASTWPSIGIESTVVRLRKNVWEVLRLGAVSLEVLARFYPVSYVLTPPKNPLCSLDQDPKDHELFLGFGDIQKTSALNLSPQGCLKEACKKLYLLLHATQNATHLGVAPIPAYDLGLSVRDTLARIAAP